MRSCVGCESTSLYGRLDVCSACYQRRRRTGSTDRQARPRGLDLAGVLALGGITLDLDPEECHVPTFYKPSRNGYYCTSFKGAGRGLHVLAWMLTSGRSPKKGEVVRHLCSGGRRGCCNPHHVTIGTQSQNCADASWRGQAEMPLGENHYNSRLVREDVREIRRLHREGLLQREIGEQFGIHQVHVSMIVTGKIWAWLDD